MRLSDKGEVQNFLSQVKQEISFKEAHSEIELELLRHLEDLAQEISDGGASPEDAMESALKRIGNAREIGQRLNQVHTPKVPWVLLVIVAGMIGLGIANVSDFGRLGSYFVSMFIGCLAGFVLYWVKPSRLSKVSFILFASSLMFLVAGTVFGEQYEGVPYLKFHFFNIDPVSFCMAPLIISLAAIFGKSGVDVGRRGYLLAAISFLPVLALSLIGSVYGAILFAVVSLAMMVAASLSVGPILTSAFVYSLTICLNLTSQRFLSADNFAVAKQSEAHTDFVLMHLHEKSALLGIIGIFLAMALVAQLGVLFMEMRSRFAKIAVAGHLTAVGLAILWSVLANLGYVAMPVSGTPLPFVSYGGSVFVGQMALLGFSAGFYRRRTLSSLAY